MNGDRYLSKQSETLRDNDGRGARVPAFACLRAALGAAIVAVLAMAGGTADAETRALKLYNTHTKERATIVFKRNGKYDRRGLAKVNQFLRDWRRNEPTKMDPELLDLVWESYQKTGSDKHIHVISGYRSPATNKALRKRSKGVARNSQHMRGKAMDFYIPGVPIAKLRAIGLRAQVGGVGYYPGSASPFVHMDTGNVRHWPKMSRSQLAKVFPKGKTLHVPRGGKPLPGYAKALAAHKLRSRKGKSAVATVQDEAPIPRKSKRNVGAPVVIASVSDDSRAAADTTLPPPLPRPSPFGAIQEQPASASAPDPVIVAMAEPIPQQFVPRDPQTFAFAAIGGNGNGDVPRRTRPHDFESASHWSSPSVPADLARAMAARDVSRPTSLPIRPTAVVATVDVSRPLRAEAITTAVMQGENGNGVIRDVTPVFAYAAGTMQAAAPVATPELRTASITTEESFGAPIPVANPLRVVATPAPAAVPAPSIERVATARLPREDLTLTALDTSGLRLWMASQSTRQKQYAVLTMPDFSSMPSLTDKPHLAYSAGFGDLAYQGLRTDRFSGPVVRMPTMVDLTSRALLAYR